MASLDEMLRDARIAVPTVTPEQARELMSRRDALLVDVRDPSEVAGSGKLQGARNVSRGMLEFRADPGAKTHDPEFRKDRPVVIYCASGGRSALAGKTLREMGYDEVYNLGGFKDAAASGFPAEDA